MKSVALVALITGCLFAQSSSEKQFWEDASHIEGMKVIFQTLKPPSTIQVGIIYLTNPNKKRNF